MGKLDELRKAGGATAAESMGVGVPLIPGVSAPGPASLPAPLQGIAKAKNVALIPLSKIGPDPDQPREEFDPESLRRLADSLKVRGQLQPIRVRWDEGRSQYVIVCGERRWRAAELAGLQTMSCVIMDGPIEPSELLAIQLVENCLREDLKPIEQAKAFRALMDRNGWSTRQLAAELAIVQPQVVRTLALLDLPAEVQGRVEQGSLSPATAYEIGKLPDAAEQQELAERVVAEGLTRQEAAEVVRGAVRRTTKGKGRGVGKAKKITARTYRNALGKATVELRKGSGLEAIRDVLRDALHAVEAELGAAAQEAA